MVQKESSEPNCFTLFKESIDSYTLPSTFNYPFYYEPHPLSILAALQLQEYLQSQSEIDHNFGLEENREGLVIGKMFGILVVQDKLGQIGFLSAFSGKLAGGNHHAGFVPPVFDILTEDGIFRKGEKIINGINAQIECLENNPEFLELQMKLKEETLKGEQLLAETKDKIKKEKNLRDQQRKKAKETASYSEQEFIFHQLSQESIKSQYFLKDLIRKLKSDLEAIQQQLTPFQTKIEQLKEERKSRSNALQQQLFDQYTFLNQCGDSKSLLEIFKFTSELQPPAGAGECAAPKLLQYAFLHQLKPIALAEFWWGRSPNTEIKKHGHFYPACRGKCEPILSHMLVGMEVDENPMLTNPALGKELQIVYEDEQLAVINKPAEFLAVPGVNIQDSVYDRMKLKYPNATGPLVVHRLDMSTSGLMLIAKSKETHKALQRQFINRKVKKQYTALLEGEINVDSGTINLPLRVDLDNRPHQMVCPEHGKYAITHWEVIDRVKGQTRVHFYPITGRTHQLRVHAAHPLGLNCPIVGDDLYGSKEKRLHLHAESIEFRHPTTKEIIRIQIDPEF